MRLAAIETISLAFKALWARIWLRAPATPLVLPQIEPPSESPPKPRKPREEINPASGFYFRGAILDRLDQYFKILSRMRNIDRKAYEMYSRVGMNIFETHKDKAMLREETNQDRLLAIRKLSPWFLKERPAFGAFGFAYEWDMSNDESLYPKFFYFQKYGKRHQPSTVQPSQGDIYLCTAYFDEADNHWLKRKLKGAPISYPVAILPDGTVQVLKMKMHEEVPVRHKHGRRRGKMFTIPKTRWGIEDVLTDWASEHKLDPYNYFAQQFTLVGNAYELANMAMLRVVCRKGKVAAIFGVNVKRSAYFFKDREPVIVDGKKKRIFHIVGAHERHVASGDTVVRMHFRGLRSFVWNGYQIDITVPGIQGDLTTFNVGAIDEDHFHKYNDAVDMEDVAEGLAEWQITGDLEHYKAHIKSIPILGETK